MLTILIVDDEMPAILAIKQRVDWKRLKIQCVLTADSAEAARALFAVHDIQLMLCDIEMPGESGLDLLDWVNRCYPETVSIFLTCHADFSYAKQAVHMGAFEYLLKPALIEDIEDVVARASAHYQKKNEQLHSQVKWQQNKATIEEQFWLELLEGRISSDETHIREEMQKRGMNVPQFSFYLPVLCATRRWLEGKSGKDMEMLDYAWNHLLIELFTLKRQPPVVLSWKPGKKIVLLPAGFAQAFGENTKEYDWLKTQCGQFIKILHDSFVGSAEFYPGGACFYIGRPTPLENLGEMFDQICRLEKRNVSYDEQIFFSDDLTQSQLEDMRPLMEQWRSLMNKEQADGLCSQIQAFLEQAVHDKKMNGQWLEIFCHNLIQMVYAVLAGRDILAEQLLKDIEPTMEEALESVEQMRLFAARLIQAAVACMSNVGHKNQVVEKVKAFVNEHIYEDISRDDVARSVYLNPNYLSRLFGNETGTSLIDYINSQKLSEASRLLQTSDLSITEVAGHVGYTNMPYFSRLFKKKFGTSPAEYRKRYV